MLISADKQTSQSIVNLFYNKDFIKVIEYIEREIANISVKSTKRKDVTETRWLQGGSQVLQELINEFSAAKERL